jgi:hypothetical protein
VCVRVCASAGVVETFFFDGVPTKEPALDTEDTSVRVDEKSDAESSSSAEILARSSVLTSSSSASCSLKWTDGKR